MVEHRVPVLGGALHRAVDPEHSDDPQVRALVGALAGLPVTPPPREHFRTELRAQLVAVTPRLVTEGMEGLVRHTPESYANAHVRPSRLHLLRLRIPRVRLGTPVRLVTAALAVIVLLASGAVWLSRSALPGDPLYNLKRASENAQLSLESGSGKAGNLLALAKTRIGEVADLLSVPSASGSGPQAGGAISSHTAKLVDSTLGSADGDVRQAAGLLGTQAVHSHSSAPLRTVISWAPAQERRLERIAAHVPAGSVHDRVASSLALVGAAYARAQALQADLGCGCLSSSGSDKLGPLPCSGCTVSSPARPAPDATTPGPGTSTSGTEPKTQTGNGGAGTKAKTTGTTPTTGGGALIGVPSPTGSSPDGVLPTAPNLPLPGSTVPQVPPNPILGTDSCGATVGLGPIGVGVGTCGVRVKIGG